MWHNFTLPFSKIATHSLETSLSSENRSVMMYIIQHKNRYRLVKVNNCAHSIPNGILTNKTSFNVFSNLPRPFQPCRCFLQEELLTSRLIYHILVCGLINIYFTYHVTTATEAMATQRSSNYGYDPFYQAEADLDSMQANFKSVLKSL